MKNKIHWVPYWQVIVTGLIAGMRSAAAPAVASHLLNAHRTKRMSRSVLGFMQTDGVARAMKVAAVGEFIADKLPFAKDRIVPISVAGRAISGALAGASIFKANNNKIVTGVLLGAGVAIASTFASFYLRKAIGKYAHIIDPVVGAAEDALVVGAGVKMVRG